MGRNACHGHRFSEGLLPELPHVQGLLPATGISVVRKGAIEGPPMRFPLSMTANLAGYIFKNKMRPRPEWQKTVAASPDASNPFRILSSKTGEKRKPHPMINK